MYVRAQAVLVKGIRSLPHLPVTPAKGEAIGEAKGKAKGKGKAGALSRAHGWVTAGHA